MYFCYQIGIYQILVHKVVTMTLKLFSQSLLLTREILYWQDKVSTLRFMNIGRKDRESDGRDCSIPNWDNEVDEDDSNTTKENSVLEETYKIEKIMKKIKWCKSKSKRQINKANIKEKKNKNLTQTFYIIK